MKNVVINGFDLTIEQVVEVAREHATVQFDQMAVERVKSSRQAVEILVKRNEPIYGITTGFGRLAEVHIEESDSKELQKNLILSHACGVGELFSEEIVRAMILLRINSLLIGNSGIRLETLDLLRELLNRRITPVVPKKGSLGASGDLVPLSHVALTLLGMGEVFYKGQRVSAVTALDSEGLKPIELGAKEGLALINGTQAMNAISALCIFDAQRLLNWANSIASLTMEALEGVIDAFDIRIHNLRRQSGQIKIAQQMLNILKDSKKVTRQGQVRVQDAYSLRCIPQVHGAVYDCLQFVEGVVKNELNAVTDNPIIFADTLEAISGGNFHGQCLASVMDFLAISLSQLGNISERRTERLVNPQLSSLPPFLVCDSGVNSGFMIVQYTAASLVNENKVLSHPASVDSITSSANQEDFVSMGMTASNKAHEVLNNLVSILAIELLCACQAIEFGGCEGLSSNSLSILRRVREQVAFIERDEFMQPNIEKCARIIRETNG